MNSRIHPPPVFAKETDVLSNTKPKPPAGPPFFSQGHAIQRTNKKRRDAETEDADPDVSAAADSASETQASSAQIAGFSTAVAAVQYLVLFQGGGRIMLSNGEEFGALRCHDLTATRGLRCKVFVISFTLPCFYMHYYFCSVHYLH